MGGLIGGLALSGGVKYGVKIGKGQMLKFSNVGNWGKRGMVMWWIDHGNTEMGAVMGVMRIVKD